jgi:predicted methyltransferase
MKQKTLLALLGLLALLFVGAWVFRTELKQFAYEEGKRDAWQQPERVVASLALQPGAAVADLGAGSGYFTYRLARAVGPAGKVYAVDVDQDMTRLVAREAAARGLANVAVILAAPQDSRLPRSSVDLVFLANTYHHISSRVEYFRSLAPALRPAGRIAVVEFKGGSGLAGWFRHSTDEETMREEMSAAGYRLREKFDYLSRQHFLIFERQ